MIHSGEGTTNGIRCRFNPSIGINFQGAKDQLRHRHLVAEED